VIPHYKHRRRKWVWGISDGVGRGLELEIGSEIGRLGLVFGRESNLRLNLLLGLVFGRESNLRLNLFCRF